MRVAEKLDWKGLNAVHSSTSSHVSSLTSGLSVFCVNPPSTLKASLSVSVAYILRITVQHKCGSVFKKEEEKVTGNKDQTGNCTKVAA
jgi:hypothetical protein